MKPTPSLSLLPILLLACASPDALASEAGPAATLLFSTRVSEVVDARVERYSPSGSGGAVVPADSRFVAQLKVGRVGEALTLVGTPVAFSDVPSDSRGYITDGGVVELPGLLPGAPVQVQLVAWLRAYGAYADTKASGQGYWGESAVFTVTAGGGASPPAVLAGLTTFQLSRIPEVQEDPLGPAPTPRVRWSANGHWYHRLEAPELTWAQARRAAESLEFRGVRGHLVTLGGDSQNENAFLSADPELGGNSTRLLEHWIGAFHPAGEADVLKGWQWITGEWFTYYTWTVDRPFPLPPGTADYSAYFREALRGAVGMDWGFVANSSLGANKPGYVVEYDTAPEGGPGPQPGPLEAQLVVVGIKWVKVLLSWPPEPGVFLLRSSAATPDAWETVPNSAGSGSFMEISSTGPTALFRLERRP